MKKSILTLFTLSSLFILAGCASDPASVNSNSGNAETLKQNENTEVVANTNDNVNSNTNAEVNTNTVGTALELSENTTEQGSEVDTSGWLTYTNDEYGFSFQYPKELFANYTSEESFPFSKIKISEAPIARLEDHFEATQGELSAEEKEIKDAVVDNKFFILLPSGIKVKTEISRAEGEALIKVFTWYDEGYQYSFTFVFPSLNDTPENFFAQYDSNEKVNKFIEQIWDGSAQKKYQEEFDLYNSIMGTLIKVK